MKAKKSQKKTPAGQNLVGKERNHQKNEESENTQKQEKGCNKMKQKLNRQPPVVWGNVTEPVEERGGVYQKWGEAGPPKRPPKS